MRLYVCIVKNILPYFPLLMPNFITTAFAGKLLLGTLVTLHASVNICC